MYEIRLNETDAMCFVMEFDKSMFKHKSNRLIIEKLVKALDDKKDEIVFISGVTEE